MTRLIVKCYLPGRRTQFVLEATGDGQARLSSDGELYPPGFDDDTSLELRCVAGQWFVEAERGDLCAVDGSVISGSLAVSPQLLLTFGAATLVFDDQVDPRLPARNITLRSPDRAEPEALETRVLDLEALGIRPAEASAQPQAPAAKPRLAPPPQLRPEELRARRPGEHTPSASLPAPIDEAPPEPAPPPLKPPRSRLKLALYSALGVAVAVSALGMMRPVAAETEARGAVARASASASVAPPVAASRPAPPPRSGPPSEKLAADLYATGEWEKARAEYEALAAVPGADPVYSVITRALSQRASRNKAKP